jgi:rhomboid family GlyGly-CTERM serine protease
MINQLFKHYRVTLLISLLAVLAWACPLLTDAMQLDYTLVAGGQWWRIWTGHLTHYDGGHLAWDLLMFAVLAAACEREHPRWFAIFLIMLMAGVTVVIAIGCPDVRVYRGLSGLDTGLFVWLVADQCRRCWKDRDHLAAAIWLAIVGGLIGKLIYEATTGQTLFVDSSNFRPLVQSHLAGALFGSVCALLGHCDPIKKGWDRTSVQSF